MIRTLKYCGTLRNMRAETVDLDLPRQAVQDRLMKAVQSGREGFVADDLARLDAGTIPLTKVEALFEPKEINAAIERRRRKLLAELKNLDRLVPRVKAEMLVSGDWRVVDDSDELAHWGDLDDPDAREMGGDWTTRRSQEKLRFERSLATLRDAANLLKK